MKQIRDDKLEKLTTTIQQKLDGNPALLIGSGCSVPYGLPSMEDLAKEIKNKLQDQYKNDNGWNTFVDDLGKTNNLEQSLENVTLSDNIHSDIIWIIWSLVGQKDIDALNNFLYNNTFPALTLILNKFIQQAGDTNIITTNYDRLIEYAIDFAEGQAETGFSNNYINKFTQFMGSTAKRTVFLWNK